MASHTLDINPLSFDQVAEGKKTLEVRLKRGGVEQIAVGDTLVIRNRETGETVEKQVASVNSYDGLDDLIQHEDLSANGSFTDPDSFRERMRSFQTEVEERQFGLVAFRLR